MKNTNKLRKLCQVVVMLSLVTIIFSCTTEWDEYKKYTKDGEIIYTGKFDTAVAFPGKERIRFWGNLTRDPKVESCKIYWNNFQDSIEFDIDVVSSDFIFDKVFEVEEGTKTFTVYTFDGAGNSSVGVTVTGISYGDRYRNTLSNRRIKSIAYDDAATTIHWDIIDKMLGPVQMEVSYKNANGDTVVITPATENSTVLKGLDYENNGFTYRTIFKPLPVVKGIVCIDTFATKFTVRSTPTFAEKELDRSLFKAVALPGDAPGNGGAGGVSAMWDGKPQNAYNGANFTDIASGGSSPQMVTIDLGMNVDLTKIVLYPFQEWWGSYYVFSTIKDFEIYGSLNPNSNGALDESWTLLKTGSIVKPSGNPKDNETAEDKAAAIAGFTQAIADELPKVRYLRIRCLNNYESLYANNSNAFFSVAEIRVFGNLPQ